MMNEDRTTNGHRNSTEGLLLDETELFYDRQFKAEYCELSPAYKTLRHIGAHAAKAGLKLVEYQRGQRPLEDIIKEVIPDLALYRSLIAVVEPEILAEGPLSPPEISGDRAIRDALLQALGSIAFLTEPAEHGSQPAMPIPRLRGAAEELHAAAVALAKQHGLNIEEAHQKRMAEQQP